MDTESGLIVVREPKPNAQVARKIYNHLRNVNFKATISELADKIDVPESQISEILNSYQVVDDSIKFVGEGRGHGWLTEEQMLQVHE